MSSWNWIISAFLGWAPQDSLVAADGLKGVGFSCAPAVWIILVTNSQQMRVHTPLCYLKSARKYFGAVHPCYF